MSGDDLARNALPVSLDNDEFFGAAVDALVTSLGPKVEVLGFGEALHGGEEILLLRNRLIRRLAGAHGFTAVALESDLVRGRLVDAYVAGGPGAYEDVAESGFSHGFGRVEANRELVEWMRSWNAGKPLAGRLRFYGFDVPFGAVGYGSPRGALRAAAEGFSSVAGPAGRGHWARIEPLLGEDAAWEDPAVFTDPEKGVGLTPMAAALRAAVEDLIADLQRRRPGWGEDREVYAEALRMALAARGVLASHAGQAQGAGHAELLGIRDLAMADALELIAERERGRGKVLAFAHNGHLQRGRLSMPGLGAWWPAGSHLAGRMGSRYAAIGTGVVASEANGIAPAEEGTLEAALGATPGPGRWVPTRRGEGWSAEELTALPARSRSAKNPSFVPLSAQSLSDFDWLAVVDSTGYSRGARPLPGEIG